MAYGQLLRALAKSANISPQKLEESEARAKVSLYSPLIDWLATGFVDAELAVSQIAQAYGTVALALSPSTVDFELARRLPAHILQRSKAFPLYHDPQTGAVRTVAVDPFFSAALDDVSRALGAPLELLVASLGDVERLLLLAFPEERIASGNTMIGETTKRLNINNLAFGQEGGLDGFVGGTTSPMHRLEDSVAPADRIEALVSVLEDKGLLTRTEYLEALRKFMV